MQAQTKQEHELGLIGLLGVFRAPEAAAEVDLSRPSSGEWVQLVWVGAGGAAVYGLATALFGMVPLQLPSSMLKPPVLIFATTLSCFLTFFGVQYAFAPREPLGPAAVLRGVRSGWQPARLEPASVRRQPG